jgi:hypothetical protein
MNAVCAGVKAAIFTPHRRTAAVRLYGLNFFPKSLQLSRLTPLIQRYSGNLLMFGQDGPFRASLPVRVEFDDLDALITLSLRLNCAVASTNNLQRNSAFASRGPGYYRDWGPSPVFEKKTGLIARSSP